MTFTKTIEFKVLPLRTNLNIQNARIFYWRTLQPTAGFGLRRALELHASDPRCPFLVYACEFGFFCHSFFSFIQMGGSLICRPCPACPGATPLPVHTETRASSVDRTTPAGCSESGCQTGIWRPTQIVHRIIHDQSVKYKLGQYSFRGTIHVK